MRNPTHRVTDRIGIRPQDDVAYVAPAIPDKALVDRSGAYILSRGGAYIVSRE